MGGCPSKKKTVTPGGHEPSPPHEGRFRAPPSSRSDNKSKKAQKRKSRKTTELSKETRSTPVRPTSPAAIPQTHPPGRASTKLSKQEQQIKQEVEDFWTKNPELDPRTED